MRCVLHDYVIAGYIHIASSDLKFRYLFILKTPYKNLAVHYSKDKSLSILFITLCFQAESSNHGVLEGEDVKVYLKH